MRYGCKVIDLIKNMKYILKLIIKCNDWLLADTCPFHFDRLSHIYTIIMKLATLYLRGCQSNSKKQCISCIFPILANTPHRAFTDKIQPYAISMRRLF